MFKKRILALILLLASSNAIAGLNIDKDCASQYKPVLNTNNNEKIANFMLESIRLSDKEYYNALIPFLKRNEEYAFKYSSRFAKECLNSRLSIEQVVMKMLLLDDL